MIYILRYLFSCSNASFEATRDPYQGVIGHLVRTTPYTVYTYRVIIASISLDVFLRALQ